MSKHRREFHTGDATQSHYLVFFKNREKFIKGAAGAIFNLTSRVLAGVIAGLIISYVTTTNPPNPAVPAATVGAGY